MALLPIPSAIGSWLYPSLNWRLLCHLRGQASSKTGRSRGGSADFRHSLQVGTDHRRILWPGMQLVRWLVELRSLDCRRRFPCVFPGPAISCSVHNLPSGLHRSRLAHLLQLSCLQCLCGCDRPLWWQVARATSIPSSASDCPWMAGVDHSLSGYCSCAGSVVCEQ